jgi:hypothetical protein
MIFFSGAMCRRIAMCRHYAKENLVLPDYSLFVLYD